MKKNKISFFYYYPYYAWVYHRIMNINIVNEVLTSYLYSFTWLRPCSLMDGLSLPRLFLLHRSKVYGWKRERSWRRGDDLLVQKS